MKNIFEDTVLKEKVNKLTYRPTFWFDMDGVLAIYELSDYFKQNGNEPLWLSEADYFAKRLVDHRAKTVFTYLAEQFDCHIISKVGYLSSLTLASTEREKYVSNHIKAKTSWLEKQFSTTILPGENYHFVTGSKSDTATLVLGRQLSSADILIDDYNANLEDWVAAGGTAIKYGNGINDIYSWYGPKISDIYSSREVLNMIAEVLTVLEEKLL